MVSKEPLFLSTLTAAADKLDILNRDLLHWHESTRFGGCSSAVLLLVIGLLVMEGLAKLRLLRRELLFANDAELRFAHLLPQLRVSD